MICAWAGCGGVDKWKIADDDGARDEGGVQVSVPMSGRMRIKMFMILWRDVCELKMIFGSCRLKVVADTSRM